MVDASVVVSVYNQEKYIFDCLKSILEQEVDFSFEVIIANDRSTDNTLEVINKFLASAPDNFKLLNNSINLGANGNYISAHNHAIGEIVFHIDGDDIMSPGKLQKQYDIFRENKNVNVVFHKATFFNDDFSYKSNTGFFSKESLVKFDITDLALWGTVAVHSSYSYRRNSRVTKYRAEFMEWFFAMDSLINGGIGIYINESLVFYRSNQNSNSYSGTSKGKIKAYNIYINDLLELFELHNGLRHQLYSNMVVSFMGMVRYCRYVNARDVRFILANLKYFSFKNIRETFLVRSSIAPIKRK
ncbi:TPA: glycosyltransferase [Vibrio cholerae]|nr:putative glycosyltransferase [Vibrio cholerae]GIB08292.1 Glycosyltransferase [Vibrio cholerae]HAS3630251.1 glycosyltransferase [Vibrio cholerae]